jgi:hypothetical protein
VKQGTIFASHREWSRSGPLDPEREHGEDPRVSEEDPFGRNQDRTSKTPEGRGVEIHLSRPLGQDMWSVEIYCGGLTLHEKRL